MDRPRGNAEPPTGELENRERSERGNLEPRNWELGTAPELGTRNRELSELGTRNRELSELGTGNYRNLEPGTRNREHQVLRQIRNLACPGSVGGAHRLKRFFK